MEYTLEQLQDDVQSSEVEALRREVKRLQEELRKLRRMRTPKVAVHEKNLTPVPMRAKQR